MHIRLLAFALALWPGLAAAEGCLDQVRDLARTQNIATDPPTASPDKAPGVTSRELGRSGGVIEPPATSDRSVITPPGTTDSRMPTMPDVTGTPGTPPGTPPGPPAARNEARKDAAADRTALQALLVAARAEAERGQEANCVDTLKKARELLERSK
ncbi:hypothetical protein [Reyranella sp.]|jgi:hypothetical protein|uniref:hypothetical protein n=1 Tax=Reyranella sp. TaxID=1929291 RepID=UPI002603647D|nr:hypothetical protein [Reyranella sp.]HQS16237.1 hypothetical protein [Reyranella sp.]HQT11518.1 hypothetical protein [Reyranella sp.]